MTCHTQLRVKHRLQSLQESLFFTTFKLMRSTADSIRTLMILQLLWLKMQILSAKNE